MKGTGIKAAVAAMAAVGLMAGVALGVAQAQPGPGQGQGQGQGAAAQPGTGLMQRGPRGERGAMMNEIAAWLGITAEQLRTEAQGTSFAQVATAHGKNPAELVAFVAGRMTARIDEALAAGRITAERAATMQAGVSARAQAFVDRVHDAGATPGQGQGQGEGRGPRAGRR